MVQFLFYNFLNHVALNSPSDETVSAGLGPIWQYGILLLVFVIIVLVYFLKKNKNNKN